MPRKPKTLSTKSWRNKTPTGVDGLAMVGDFTNFSLLSTRIRPRNDEITPRSFHSQKKKKKMICICCLNLCGFTCMICGSIYMERIVCGSGCKDVMNYKKAIMINDCDISYWSRESRPRTDFCEIFSAERTTLNWRKKKKANFTNVLKLM